MIKVEYTLEKAGEVEASMLSEQTYADSMSAESSADAAMQVALSDAWANCSNAWAVAASIHERFASKKDPFYTTRQQDLLRNAAEARKNQDKRW